MSRLLPMLLLLAACGAPPRPALSPEDERVLRPIPDPPEGVRKLVDRGDVLFVQAIGDRGSALELYGKARAAYLEAQTLYSGLIPAPLLDRVKACVHRIAQLQRERHRSQ